MVNLSNKIEGHDAIDCTVCEVFNPKRPGFLQGGQILPPPP